MLYGNHWSHWYLSVAREKQFKFNSIRLYKCIVKVTVRYNQNQPFRMNKSILIVLLFLALAASSVVEAKLRWNTVFCIPLLCCCGKISNGPKSTPRPDYNPHYQPSQPVYVNHYMQPPQPPQPQPPNYNRWH